MKMIYQTMIQQFMLLLAIASSTSAYISIVTGANGFVGRHVVYSLLQQHNTRGGGKNDDDETKDGEQIIVCLVRPEKVAYEESYWDAHLMDMQQSSSSSQKLCVKVMPYDMLDNGLTLNNALEAAAATEEENGTSSSSCGPICIYHIASVFGPTPDPIQTAQDNVQSAEDVVRTLDTFHRRHNHPLSLRSSSSRLVLTSSMAAVRATDQTPLNGKHYTHRDWNTLSKLNSENWGSCYQWSKAESERRAWELVRECNERYANENDDDDDDDDGSSNQIEMIALCPSFVFGPPPPMPSKMMNDATHKNTMTASSSSFSLTLIDQWLRGQSAVQSRLCGDVRDVAMAHVVAGTMRTLPKDNADRRYILSTEERLSSESTAKALIRGVERASQKRRQKGGDIDIDMSEITCDTQFTGGAIEIGEREVEASERAERDLGVVFRPVEETMRDMAESLLDSM